MVAALLARSDVAGAEVRHHDRKAAPVRHGVAGIDGEIDERGLELRRVDLDEPEPVLGLEIDLDALAERALQELDHPGHEVLQVDDAGLKRLPAREGEEAVGEIGAALRALDREAHAPSRLLVAVERGAEEIEVADDDAQHVVEVVRDAAGEPADGLELRGVQQALLELAPLGDVEHGAEDLAAAAAFARRQHALIEEEAVLLVGASPAILAGIGAGLLGGHELGLDAVAILGMDAGDAELGVGREAARREAGQALDIVADEQGREGRVHAAGGDDDRQRAQDRLLPLERPAQLAFGLELLAADLEVLDEQPALLGALAADLLGLAIEVDEDVDLRLQDQRLDRLEDVVDGAGRVAAKDVQVVLVVGGQEQDRDARRARPRPDHARRARSRRSAACGRRAG